MEVENIYPGSAVLNKMVWCFDVLRELFTAQSQLLLLVSMSGASLRHYVDVVPHPLPTKERFPFSNLEKERGSEENKDAGESDDGEDDGDDDENDNDDDDDDNDEDDDYSGEGSDDDDDENGDSDGAAGANGDGRR